MSIRNKSTENSASVLPEAASTIAPLISRLRSGGKHLGNVIAGYRDKDSLRSAQGLFKAASAMLDAADRIEVLTAALKQLSFAAQTSGGVAGRDDALFEAIGVAEAALLKSTGDQ